MKSHFKLKISLIVLALISIIALIILYIYLHSATLLIQVAPYSANISINQKIYQNGLYKVKPEKQIEVTVSADGFKPETFSIELPKNQATTIITSLTPTEDNQNFYQKSENRDSLSILIANNDLEPSPDLQNTLKKISLQSSVPIETSYCGTPATRANCNSVSINYDYYPECENLLCVKITGRKSQLDEETLNVVRGQLSKLGYNLNDYQYFYQQSDK